MASFFQEIVVDKKNYFELLKISPELSPGEVVVRVIHTNDVQAHLKTKIISTLNNPLKRFMQEVLTFPKPNYSAEFSEENRAKFNSFLKHVFDNLLDEDEFEFGQIYYLYTKIEETHDFRAMGVSPTKDIFANIAEQINADPVVCHTFAVIYMKLALRFSERGDFDNAGTSWKRAIFYWKKLVENMNFLTLTETAKFFPDQKRIEDFGEEFRKIPGYILEYLQSESKMFLVKNNLREAVLRIKWVYDIEACPGDTSILETMLFDLFAYLDTSFIGGHTEEGMSGNYDKVLGLLLEIKKEIYFPTIEEQKQEINDRVFTLQFESLFLYELEKYINVVRERTSSNNYEAIVKILAKIENLIERAEYWTKKSQRPFEVTQKLEDLLMAVQNAGVRCSNDIDLQANAVLQEKYRRMALAILEAIPDTRTVNSDNGTQITIRNLRDYHEIRSFWHGDVGFPKIEDVDDRDILPGLRKKPKAEDRPSSVPKCSNEIDKHTVPVQPMERSKTLLALIAMVNIPISIWLGFNAWESENNLFGLLPLIMVLDSLFYTIYIGVKHKKIWMGFGAGIVTVSTIFIPGMIMNNDEDKSSFFLWMAVVYGIVGASTALIAKVRRDLVNHRQSNDKLAQTGLDPKKLIIILVLIAFVNIPISILGGLNEWNFEGHQILLGIVMLLDSFFFIIYISANQKKIWVGIAAGMFITFTNSVPSLFVYWNQNELTECIGSLIFCSIIGIVTTLIAKVVAYTRNRRQSASM